jgi:hypothetical protein
MEGKTFEIGLVMAGAVSAGAYTAGVVDYLIEVLDTWDQARKAGKNVPMHDVKIKVLTGASAGGMTAAISIAELLNRPSMPDGKVPSDYKSLLYQAWVEKIDISHLLKTNDLKEDNQIKSLLDSTIIEEIASEIINAKALTEKVKSWKNIPFVEEELKVYLTLSNLRGLPYEFKLQGETGFPYGMTDHSDYQYVKVWEKTTEQEWNKLREAAIATGAFPVGLAPRLIERDLEEYKVRIHKDGRAISGLLNIKTDENKPYHFIAVDGGTLNNEPIELARSYWVKVDEGQKDKIKTAAMAEDLESEAEQKAEDEQCPYALILLDPFPDLADAGEDATEKGTALSKIVAPLIGALRAQSLFKMEELIRAGDAENDQRFLVSPIRYTDKGAMAKNAIACGFFGGFGGFLSEDFRKHDYYLGRRNCQRFLQKYFVVEKSKADAKFGWKPVAGYDIKRQVEVDGKTVTKIYYPVIPIINGTQVAAPQGENNNWPIYTKDKQENLQKNLPKRVSALLDKTLPFGWIGEMWVLVIIILAFALVFAGELMKLVGTEWDEKILFGITKITFVDLFQVILLLTIAVLGSLRIGRGLIQNKIVKTAYNMFLSEVKKWRIEIEK